MTEIDYSSLVDKKCVLIGHKFIYTGLMQNKLVGGLSTTVVYYLSPPSTMHTIKNAETMHFIMAEKEKPVYFNPASIEAAFELVEPKEVVPVESSVSK